MDIEQIVGNTIRAIARNVKQSEVRMNPEGGHLPADEMSGFSGLAKYIDHTLLRPDACMREVDKICDEAMRYGFASVCVNSTHIASVAHKLSGSRVLPCCVIGFPLGAMAPAAKSREAAHSVDAGARELDMVINIGAVKSHDWDLVYRDIESVVSVAQGRAGVKVIVETCLLTDEEKIRVCVIAKLAGAHFVKTSTGFSDSGATAGDVALMRQVVGAEIGVKASGGIRTSEDAVKMIRSGANRLGTSSGIAIVSGNGGGTDPFSCLSCGACSKRCPGGRTAIVRELY
jgi:deoxyribose-phosphate aldolase